MQIVLCCLIWGVAASVLVHTEEPPGGAGAQKGRRIEKSIIQTQNPPEEPHLSCPPECLNGITSRSATPDRRPGASVGHPIRKPIHPSLHQYLAVDFAWFCSVERVSDC